MTFVYIYLGIGLLYLGLITNILVKEGQARGASSGQTWLAAIILIVGWLPIIIWETVK